MRCVLNKDREKPFLIIIGQWGGSKIILYRFRMNA